MRPGQSCPRNRFLLLLHKVYGVDPAPTELPPQRESRRALEFHLRLLVLLRHWNNKNPRTARTLAATTPLISAPEPAVAALPAGDGVVSSSSRFFSV